MILNKLREATGTKAKEYILRTEVDTFDKKMFQYAYDTSKTYGVKFNNINWRSVKPLSQLDMIILDKLINGDIRGNKARETVISHCENNGDLIKLICNKDLDCGVTARTLNKIYGKGFIPDFQIQLATEVELYNINLPILGQIKYNGVRVLAHITTDGVKFRTRGSHYFEFPALAEALRHSREGTTRDFILDGEICIGDSKNSNHTNVSGIINSAIKGNPVKDIHGLVFQVFDILPIDDFYIQKCDMDYFFRWNYLISVVDFIDNYLMEDSWRVQLAETTEFDSVSEIENKFATLLASGYEGLILKRWDHKYSFKRSRDWIKLKASKSADLECTGVNEGKDKYAGGIGSLICEGTVEGKEVLVNVSSGMKDFQRMLSPNKYLGQTIEVGYNSIIVDKPTGRWSLFIPKFVTVRGDL